MAVSSPIQSIAGDEKLALDFFETFSRFECGLMRAGFVKRGVYDSASPKWGAFADAIDGELTASTDTDFTNAKTYLLGQPPQLQKFDPPNGVRWQHNAPNANETDTRYLLRLVRDARNNLFHGGKYPVDKGGPIESPAKLRNAELLKACLTVLHTCLSCHAGVKSEFEQAH
jgi:hypothetical protein